MFSKIGGIKSFNVRQLYSQYSILKAIYLLLSPFLAGGLVPQPWVWWVHQLRQPGKGGETAGAASLLWLVCPQLLLWQGPGVPRVSSKTCHWDWCWDYTCTHFQQSHEEISEGEPWSDEKDGRRPEEQGGGEGDEEWLQHVDTVRKWGQ